MRALVCFMSASVGAPTRIKATPPESLASRSWNFSLSYSLSVSSICRRSWSIRRWMSAFLPAPWMIVVLSLLTLTCLALPSCVELKVLQLQAQVFADHRAAGQDRHVAEHRLAAVAESRCLDRADVEHAAQLVDDQGRQRFAFDFLGDDQERACPTARPSRGAEPSRGGC